MFTREEVKNKVLIDYAHAKERAELNEQDYRAFIQIVLIRGFADRITDFVNDDCSTFDLYEDITNMAKYLPLPNLKMIEDYCVDENGYTKHFSCYSDMRDELGSIGALKFRPYPVTMDNKNTIVVKYNRFLNNYKGMYYQLFDTNKSKSFGHSFQYIREYCDIKNDELRVLFYLTSIIEPISHIVDIEDLLGENWFIKFLAEEANVSDDVVKNAIRTRIQFNSIRKPMYASLAVAFPKDKNKEDMITAYALVDFGSVYAECVDIRTVSISMRSDDMDLNEYMYDFITTMLVRLAFALVNYHVTTSSGYPMKEGTSVPVDILHSTDRYIVTSIDDILAIHYKDAFNHMRDQFRDQFDKASGIIARIANEISGK